MPAVGLLRTCAPRGDGGPAEVLRPEYDAPLTRQTVSAGIEPVQRTLCNFQDRGAALDPSPPAPRFSYAASGLSLSDLSIPFRPETNPLLQPTITYVAVTGPVVYEAV